MQNQLIHFSFNTKEVRVTDQNGNEWFILRDLLDAMESKTTTTAAVESIKQGLGEVFVNDIPLQTAGGMQQVIIVAESAATYLLSRSNTDKGRELNRFIHVEVLPSIRKTGKYEVKNDIDELETLGKMIIALSEERKRVRKLEEESKKTIERLDQIETATDHFTVIGYMRYTKSKNIDLPTAAKLGSKMTRYCKQHEIQMGNVPDPRFGMVHTYPKWAMEKVLN